MNYIIFDLEWNHHSARNRKKYKKYNPRTKGFNEIIEIGAIKLNEKFDIIDTFRVFIKPNIYKAINHNILDLTGITDEDLKYGLDFEKAMTEFIKWMGTDYYTCTWSDTDIRVLKNNFEYYFAGKDIRDIIFPFIDIQKYCMDLLKEKNQISLKDASERLCIQLKDEFHMALSDTKFTFEIFKKIYKKENIQDYIVNDFNNMYYNKVGEVTNKEIVGLHLNRICKVCNNILIVENYFFDARYKMLRETLRCDYCNRVFRRNTSLRRNLNGDLIVKKRKNEE